MHSSNKFTPNNCEPVVKSASRACKIKIMKIRYPCDEITAFDKQS